MNNSKKSVEVLYSSADKNLLKRSKEEAYGLIKTYSDVYKDPNSTKDDLKDAANAAIRAMANVMDVYNDLNQQLADTGKLLIEHFTKGANISRSS